MASDPQHGDHGEAESHEGSHEEHSGHEFHLNHIALFFGVTDEEHGDGERERAFTLGIDYERRVSRVTGFGIIADYAYGDLRTLGVTTSVFFHFTERWKIDLGVGLERSSGETETLFRIGLVYDIPVGSYVLAPGLHLDLVDGEEVWVYGLYIGRGF